MWAALGNFLKNKLKKTAINAAKGDESSQRSLLIIGVSCIGLFLVVIILITIIIFGPVIVTKEFIEKVKNSEVSVTIDKINNVLSLKGWCSDIDGSCEKKIEQQYYEKLGEVYDKNNKNVDTQLITGTIFYNYSLGTNIYEENEDGINERFVNMYCDSIPGWGYEVACDVLIKNNKEKYMELYASKKDRYTLLSSNYEQIKEKCKNDNNSLKDKTMLIPALIPFSISLDVTVSEACEFYIWHAEDIGEYSQIEQDIQYMTYKRAMEDNLIETLANQMLSGGRIDYTKYRDYLIKNYIPTYLKDAYKYSSEKEKKIEMIADEIMSFASKNNNLYTKYGTSYISSICNEVCLTTGQCYSLEDYVAGVVNGESFIIQNKTSNYAEQWKAQAVAARTFVLYNTNWCKKPIENSSNRQNFLYNNNIEIIKEVIKETDGQVLTYDGEIINAQYDSFFLGGDFYCDEEFCYQTYKKKGLESTLNPEKHQIKVPIGWKSSLAGGHGYGMSQYGAAYLADIGWGYEEILEYFYAENVMISNIVSTIKSGEFMEGLLFPLGVNSLTGRCVSAGNYYSPGGNQKYHGAVDISSNMMGYSKPYEEVPVIASIGGKIISIEKNKWCSNTKYSNSDTRLPRIAGCQGNHMTILVTDPTSQYYNYRFIYYHLDSIDQNLNINDMVVTGQFLGYMGSTGNSTGPHLHFKIKDASGNDVNNYPVQDVLTNLLKDYCKKNVGG